MKTVDCLFGWLLVLASLMHGAGSVLAYGHKPELLLWAEAATLAGLLLAAINLLRADRPGDRTLAWVSCAGCVGWTVVAFGFGHLAGSRFDPRALSHEAIALVLLVFSLRSTRRVTGELMGEVARSARPDGVFSPQGGLSE